MTTVLDREMYTEARAARLLRVAPATLHYWLEGGTRRNRTYKPVIREEATGSRTVTWAEFVEAGLLRQYRRRHKVPMGELRSFIDRLRDRMGGPYPLAHYQPYIGDLRLIFEAQREAKLDADLALVAEVSGQYVLTTPSQEFFERVRWEGDIAVGWRPDANGDSPVFIDPEIRSGRPSVGGISTEILLEQAEAGQDHRDLADTYGLTLVQVRWALSYELPFHAA
jgi:uncharacterized protein (DUF433 family)